MSDHERAPQPQKRDAGKPSIREKASILVALVALACVLFLIGLPFYCIRTLVDTGAFLARATARSEGTVHFITRSITYYSNPDGGFTVPECLEEITFQPARGKPVSFLYDYYPDFRLVCDRERAQLAVLYNPRNPVDVRVARSVYGDRTNAIIGLIIWSAGVCGGLAWLVVKWQGRRRKRRQGLRKTGG